MVDRVLALPEGTRAYLLAPVVRGRKGEYRKELAEWQRAGFTRVRIDGEMVPIEEAPALDKKFKHDIEVVVDRIVVRPDMASRLAESFEQALKLADGLAYVDLVEGTVAELGAQTVAPAKAGASGDSSATSPETPASAGVTEGKMKGAGIPENRIIFSEKFACPVSGFTISEIEPRLFSFNAPQGACPACDGLGEKMLFDDQLVVPQREPQPQEGRRRPLGQVQPAQPLLHAGARQPRGGLRLQPRHGPGRTCPARSASSSCTAPAASPSPSPSRTAARATASTSPSRA